MRLRVDGNCQVGNYLRAWLNEKPDISMTDKEEYDYKVNLIEDPQTSTVILDSIDCAIERNIMNQLFLNGIPSFTIVRKGGIQSDKEITIKYPPSTMSVVAKGVYQGLRMTIEPVNKPKEEKEIPENIKIETPKRRINVKVTIILAILFGLIGLFINYIT